MIALILQAEDVKCSFRQEYKSIKLNETVDFFLIIASL